MRRHNLAMVVALPTGRMRGPIDMTHLSKQALGDWGIQVEVLRLFAEMSANYLDRLELSQTHAEAMMQLHALKGASAGVGAWHLRDLAGEAEADMRLDEIIDPERMGEIRAAVIEIERYLGELLRDEAV